MSDLPALASQPMTPHLQVQMLLPFPDLADADRQQMHVPLNSLAHSLTHPHHQRGKARQNTRQQARIPVTRQTPRTRHRWGWKYGMTKDVMQYKHCVLAFTSGGRMPTTPYSVTPYIHFALSSPQDTDHPAEQMNVAGSRVLRALAADQPKTAESNVDDTGFPGEKRRSETGVCRSRLAKLPSFLTFSPSSLFVKLNSLQCIYK